LVIGKLLFRIILRQQREEFDNIRILDENKPRATLLTKNEKYSVVVLLCSTVKAQNEESRLQGKS
jgi:hypothetical protein